jgi:multiple sugar transport system permease protein
MGVAWGFSLTRKPVRSGAAAASANRRSSSGPAAHYQAQLRLMLAPYLVGVVVLVAAPALLTLSIALFNYDTLSPPVWTGLSNFGEVFIDRLFWVAARNSIVFVALAVPLRMLGALLLALLLHRRRAGVRAYRTAVYLPTIIPDVAYALIWLWIFNPLYGPLNLILGALGLPTPAWLVDSRTALPAIVLMSLFQIGEGIVVLLAALQGVPRDYYQAAEIDGASRLQLFFRITLPLIAPWLLVLSARDIIFNTQNTFVPAFLMTGGQPYYSTLFMPLLIYEEAFDRFRFGEGSVMLLLMLIWVGLLLWLVYDIVGGWGYADEV